MVLSGSEPHNEGFYLNGKSLLPLPIAKVMVASIAEVVVVAVVNLCLILVEILMILIPNVTTLCMVGIDVIVWLLTKLRKQEQLSM